MNVSLGEGREQPGTLKKIDFLGRYSTNGVRKKQNLRFCIANMNNHL